MTNQTQNSNEKKQYDLEERTARFGENVLILVGSISDNLINRPLTSQLVRSATSVGANYMEANGAESKKDFMHKIGICKKEAKETMHWLRMLATANPAKNQELQLLWQEVHELVLIFSAITKHKIN